MAARDEISYIIRARDGFSTLHKKANKTIQRSADIAKKATLAVGASFAVATVSLAAMVKTTATAGDEFQKMAARLGISTQTLTELKFAAELSGASLENIENGLRKMSKTALDADRGLATAKRSFDELGISVNDSRGELKDSEALFTEVIAALDGVESSTRKTALAQEFFGRSGTALIPLIDAGAEGLAEMRQQAEDLGITFNTLEADQSAAFIDAELRIKSAVIGMKNSLGNELMPFVTDIMDSLAQEFIDFKKTGDLDEWAADVAEGVITVFSAAAEFATNVPLIWSASMTSIKTISAEGVAILDTVFIGVEKFYDLLGGLPGDIGLPYRQAANDIKNIRAELSDVGTELLISADASSRSGEKWGEWQGKALSAIAAVKSKSQEIPLISATGSIVGKPTEIPAEEDSQIKLITMRMQFRDEEIDQLKTVSDVRAFYAERDIAVSEAFATKVLADNQIMAASNEMLALSRVATARVSQKANEAMEDQILSLVETGNFSIGAMANIMAQQVKIELVGLAARAAVQALYFTAMGIAGSTPWGAATVGPGAVWFAAAGKMALIAGAATAGAAAVSSVSSGAPGRSTGGSSAAPLTTSDRDSLIATDSTAAQSGQNVTVNLNIEGVISPDNLSRVVEEQIMPELERSSERGNSIKLNVLSTEE